MRSSAPLIALLLLCVACKKDSPPAPAAAPAEPTSAPRKPAVPNPLLQVPLTDSTLSLFEPREGRCEWLRLDPVAQKRSVVATFEGDCRGARVSWSADGKKAAVWFDPQTVQQAGYSSQGSSAPGYPDEVPLEDASPKAYAVTLKTGSASLLPAPAGRGALGEVAVGAAGEVLAFRLENLDEAQAEKGAVEVEGETIRLPTDGEGLPALAHAYKLTEAGSWKRIETQPTTEGWDYAPGWRATLASQSLGPRTIELLAGHFQGDGVDEEAVQQKLAAFTPKGATGEDGQWIFGGTSAGRFYVWEVSGEFAYTTGRVVFDDAGTFSAAPGLGFTDGDLVAIDTAGAFLLISSRHAGTHPRLYDGRTRALVFSSDTARAAVFWPGGSKAR